MLHFDDPLLVARLFSLSLHLYVAVREDLQELCACGLNTLMSKNAHCCLSPQKYWALMSARASSSVVVNQIASSGILHNLPPRKRVIFASTYVSRFAVEEVSTAISRAAKELGFRQLKDKQYQTVSEFACGKDVFLTLPTGGGKSLCYALLPAVYDVLRQRASPTSIVNVVSPLLRTE